MIRKSFELLKDKLFDLCYEIIWMKKWMLAGIICTGIFFFYMSYLSHQTAVIWKNIPPRNELQRVSGCLSEYDRRRGIQTCSIFEDGKLSLSKDNCSVASPGPLYNMVDDAHHVSSLFVPPASAAEWRLI